MGARLSYPNVDLSGKVAVVTGGNAGIGYETVKQLALMGAHTIMACRSEEKAKAAIEQMTTEVESERPGSGVQVEFMPLDLASLQSTKDFVAAFKERNLPLHILINNAGIAWVPQTITDDGFELQFQVNHLSHFLLTLELLPTILAAASSTGDCRIVFVSSLAHTWVSEWEPDNLNGERWYGRIKFYPKSKLCNVLTAYALQRRLQNVGITVSTLHPGTVGTGIASSGFSDSRIISSLAGVLNPLLRSPKDGAATTINCATNPDLNSQQCFYYSDCRPVESSELSRNEQMQEELWRISVDFLKDHLSPEILDRYGPTTPSAPPTVTEGTETGVLSATPTSEKVVGADPLSAPPTLMEGTETGVPTATPTSEGADPPPAPPTLTEGSEGDGGQDLSSSLQTS